MTMDSNSLGNLIDVMMMSSSNSSSSSRSACENDAKKRRFSEAQVKSLEVMFEEQTKLEPRKKQQLAKELGLQPRQVAIWFQNKRARWKSKQLERAYAALSADYDSLRSSFDSLLHQKNVLSMQVERLAEMLETNPQEKKERGKQSTDCRVEGGDGEADQTPMLNLSSNANNSDAEKELLSPFLGGKEAEHHLQRTKEQGGSRSLVSDESEQQQQFCFNNTAGWPSDQLVTGGVCSQWWEFLSYE